MKLAVAEAIPGRERATPLERLELLCDPGSVRPIRTGVASRGGRSAPGDGVLGAAGTVAGRPLYCYAQDGGFVGGSLGAAGAATIVRVLRLAGRAGVPVVGFVESGGARMEDGTGALAGYGEIFRATVELGARVPQLTVVTGTSAGGGAYAPALTDLVVMVKGATMFLTGPGVVHEVTGERIDAAALGGARVHERNGVCARVAADDEGAAEDVRELLALLPRNRASARRGGRRSRPWCPTRRPPSRSTPAAPTTSAERSAACSTAAA